MGTESFDGTTEHTVGVAGGEFSADGVSASIPASAMSSNDSVRIMAGDVATEGTAGELFGTALGIDHDAPLSAPVEVRWDISALNEGQRELLTLVHFDDELGVWVADPSTLDVPRRFENNELVAEIQDWTWWSWSTVAKVGQWTGEQTGQRVEAPTCPGQLPEWASNPVDPDQDTPAAAVRVCYEADDSGGVTIRVANNRTFTQQLRFVDDDFAFSWTWHGEPEITVDRIIDEMAWRIGSDSTLLLPPLHEIAVGVARPTDAGAFHIELEADVNPTTMFVDLVKYGASKVFDLDLPGDPVMNAFLTVLFECGGELLDRPETDVDGVARFVLSTLHACADLIVSREGDFGEMYESIALRAVNTDGAAGRAIFERLNRFAVKATAAFKLIGGCPASC